jgi:hypothetical protein
MRVTLLTVFIAMHFYSWCKQNESSDIPCLCLGAVTVAGGNNVLVVARADCNGR